MKNRCGKELYMFKIYNRNKLLKSIIAISEYHAKMEYAQENNFNVYFTRIEAYSIDTNRLINVSRY